MQHEFATKTWPAWAGLIAAAAALPAVVVAQPAPTSAAGLQTGIRFTEQAPQARTPELIRRLFSPLQAHRTNEAIAKSGRSVSEQSLDLTRESFAMYVPPTMPAAGYALLVFVPPWEEATVPRSWMHELDRHGMIFVTAARSGNDASILDRREPLALTAAHNVMLRYRVDPAHVYVGGFSGGSRVALRLALGYPDLFRGALLNAGSDPIGSAQVPLPPAGLMHRFQEHSRLVYLTGKEDAPRLEMDRQSLRSMQDWCVFDVASVLVAWSGHEAPSGAAFNQGLDALQKHEAAAPEKLGACRRRYEDDLDRQLRDAQRLQASGDNAGAKSLLEAVDARFGGLSGGADSADTRP